MAQPFFTIGHSTRSIQEFADLLCSSGVERVADVRTIPRSRTNPQFNKDNLPKSLERFRIGYEHIADLGGLRGKHGRRASPNGFWENDSFRNYADYALTDAFRSGLAHLRDLGRKRRTAIMCAEAVWWRCHRRIIADYLLSMKESVFHIMGPHAVVPAVMTPAAQPAPGGSGLIYPSKTSPAREASLS